MMEVAYSIVDNHSKDVGSINESTRASVFPLNQLPQFFNVFRIMTKIISHVTLGPTDVIFLVSIEKECNDAIYNKNFHGNG